MGYCYPSGLKRTFYKWDIYILLVTKGLNFVCDAKLISGDILGNFFEMYVKMYYLFT